MTTVRVQSDIGAPVDAVFARFTDIQQSTAHVGGIKDVQLLTPGKFSLGTRWRETRDVFGRLDDAEMEITSFEKNRQYTITHHKARVRVDTTFTFDPIPAGTRVTIEFSLNSQGLPPGLLTPIQWAIAGKVKGVLADDLADLKASVETLAWAEP